MASHIGKLPVTIPHGTLTGTWLVFDAEDAVSAANHGVAQTDRTPCEPEAWAPVALIAKHQRAAALRFSGSGRVHDLVAVRIEAGPVIAEFLPRLEVIVANSQINRQRI